MASTSIHERTRIMLPPSVEDLESLRSQGDYLCDTALEALLQHRRRGNNIEEIKFDHLEAMLRYIKAVGTDDPKDPVQVLFRHVTSVPSWVNWSDIRNAQDSHWRYNAATQCALLHASLIGGFGAPRITKVLTCTGYLSDKNPSLIRNRLFETARLVSDCMSMLTLSNALTPITGPGWKSALRVRFLHAQVRRHILKVAARRSDFYDQNDFGVPINQEDMIATLCAFSTLVVSSLARMGIRMTGPEIEHLIAAWRYIGYLMGVDPKLDPLRNFVTARQWHEAIFSHLIYPDESSRALVKRVVSAFAETPYLRKSPAFHGQLMRELIGTDRANARKLPDSLIVKLACRFHFFLFRILASVCSMEIFGWGSWCRRRVESIICQLLCFWLEKDPEVHKFQMTHIPGETTIYDEGQKITNAAKCEARPPGVRGISRHERKRKP